MSDGRRKLGREEVVTVTANEYGIGVPVWLSLDGDEVRGSIDFGDASDLLDDAEYVDEIDPNRASEELARIERLLEQGKYKLAN